MEARRKVIIGNVKTSLVEKKEPIIAIKRSWHKSLNYKDGIFFLPTNGGKRYKFTVLSNKGLIYISKAPDIIDDFDLRDFIYSIINANSKCNSYILNNVSNTDLGKFTDEKFPSYVLKLKRMIGKNHYKFHTRCWNSINDVDGNGYISIDWFYEWKFPLGEVAISKHFRLDGVIDTYPAIKKDQLAFATIGHSNPTDEEIINAIIS